MKIQYSENLPIEVIQKAQIGDKKALHSVVAFYLPRIKLEARRYKHLPMDERMSAGYEGFMRGLHKFNPRVDTNFWKYVFFHVRAYMIKDAKGTRTTKRWVLGDFSSRSVVSGIAGRRKDDAAGQTTKASLDLVGDYDPRFEKIEVDQEFQEARRLVAACLSKRESEVFQRRLVGETLQAVGDSLGISRERTRQIELRARLKLQAAVG